MVRCVRSARYGQRVLAGQGKSWSSALAPRGADQRTTGTEERSVANRKEATLRRCATAGRYGSTANGSATSRRPAFAPAVSLRADLRPWPRGRHPDLLTYTDEQSAERCATTSPAAHPRRLAGQRERFYAILDDVGGACPPGGATRRSARRGRFDGQDVLNEIDLGVFLREHRSACPPRANSTRSTSPPTPTARATAPSWGPQDQDPDELLGRLSATGNGIVVRGAKFEDRGGLRQSGVRQADDRRVQTRFFSDYAVGFLADMGAGHQGPPGCSADRRSRMNTR